MKNSTVNTSAFNLPCFTWLAFQQANPGGSYVRIGASFVPDAISCTAEAAGQNPILQYNIFAASASVVPAWIRPGTPIYLTASVTISAKDYVLTGSYIVTSVASDGTYFTVNAPRSTASRSKVAFTSTFDKTSIDNGSGAVSSPTCELLMQAQKVMFKASSGSVTIAPCVDAAGNAPYEVALTSTSGEYEVTAPTGAKFDQWDWYVKGTGTLAVRFM